MTPVSRRPVRLGWWLVAVLLGSVTAAVVVTGIDWGRRRAFYDFLASRDLNPRISYANPIFGEAAWVDRLRDVTAGPISFDHPVEVSLNDGAFDDASVDRLVDGFERLGEPR